jgi:hypothetical protein
MTHLEVVSKLYTVVHFMLLNTLCSFASVHAVLSLIGGTLYTAEERKAKGLHNSAKSTSELKAEGGNTHILYIFVCAHSHVS